MTVQIDFVPFAAASGANVETQSAYLADSALGPGVSSGLAKSALANKVWRQSSIISAVVAQFIGNFSGQNVIDDGTTATILTNLITALQTAPPGRLINVQSFTASATYTPTTGTNKIRVTVIGGGAAGGGAAATGAGQFSVGGGGQAGSMGIGIITSGFSGAFVNVGIGGTGIAGAAGNSGNTSGFGSFITAPGGAPGTTTAASSSAVNATGGYTAVSASGGSILNIAGQAGGNGSGQASASFAYGGGGGSSLYGGGGPWGLPAKGYGSGGGGVINVVSQSAAAGGSGTGGIIIVEEFS